jgi:formate dehydrogenase subunit gamma
MQTETHAQIVGHILDAKKEMPGALLPILHDVQDALGFVPPEVVPAIAQALNLSRAEVHGVVSYYHHFRSEPAGRSVVQICRAEACKAMGSDALWEQACQHTGGHGHSGGGAVTLEAAYCLGLCASSPAMSVNDKPYARLTSEKLVRILKAAGSVA